jgi:hypothetical protein
MDAFKYTLMRITKAGGSEVIEGVILAFRLLLQEIHFFNLAEGYTHGTPAWFANSLVELNWMEIVFEQMLTIL